MFVKRTPYFNKSYLQQQQQKKLKAQLTQPPPPEKTWNPIL